MGRVPDTLEIFAGAVNLGNPAGSFYRGIHTQVAALTLAAARNPTPGGWALVVIDANGDGITVPAAWIKYGGDDVDPADGQRNHLQVFFKDDDTIYYTNKVETP